MSQTTVTIMASSEFKTDLKTQVKNRSTRLAGAAKQAKADAKAEKLLAAEAAKQAKVDAKAEKLLAAEAAKQAKVDAKAEKLLAAEAAKQAKVDAKAEKLLAAEAAKQAKVDAKAEKLRAAEAAKQAKVDAKAEKLRAAEATKQAKIDAKAEKLRAAEAAKQAKIDAKAEKLLAAEAAKQATAEPTAEPTTTEPTVEPTAEPTTVEPAVDAAVEPTVEPTVEPARPIASDPTTSKADKAERLLIPWTGTCDDSACKAIKLAYGLFTQCTNNVSDEEYCRACATACSKAGTTIPVHGNTTLRLAVAPMDYVTPSGKKVVTYAAALRATKSSMTHPEAIARLANVGIVLDAAQFGENKKKKAAVRTGKKGVEVRVEEKHDIIKELVEAARAKLSSESIDDDAINVVEVMYKGRIILVEEETGAAFENDDAQTEIGTLLSTGELVGR
jgi:hypothetical protein